MAFNAKMPAAEDWFKSDGSGLSAPAIHYLGSLQNIPSSLAVEGGVLDRAFGSTRGAIIYRGSLGWAKLDPGTSGDFLKTLGAGADPAWAAVSQTQVFLDSKTASNSSSLDFTSGIDSTYDNYLFLFENIIPVSDTLLKMRVSTNAGSSWESSNYVANVTSDTGAIVLSSFSIIATSGGGASGRIMLGNPSSSSVYKKIYSHGAYISTGPAYSTIINGGTWMGATTAINGIRFLMHSGNISSGTIRMYGLKGS